MESKTATSKEITFPVQGMSCGSCVRQIKAALEGNTGVERVEVNLAAGEVTVSYNPQTTAPAVIAGAIRKSGYKPGVPRAEQ
jgi:copper chaperone CopZ